MLERAQEDVPDEIGSGERFEIPDVETQKEGNKTIIRNFSDIVDRFNRDPDHLTKYLLDELGTAGHREGNELVLNGSFRRGTLDDRIESYAETFVICPECGRPDTGMEKEKGVELLKCEACGARTPVEG